MESINAVLRLDIIVLLLTGYGYENRAGDRLST